MIFELFLLRFYSKMLQNVFSVQIVLFQKVRQISRNSFHNIFTGIATRIEFSGRWAFEKI